ncbi:MAG: hypothetical protein LLF76_10095 [Planctomycetaceae bacterium]|nr:hypothetical protein [Planctomycetaceae bacterium]
MKKELGLAVCGILVLSAAVLAYPKPAGVQGERQWTLNVEYSQPEQLVVSIPGENKIGRFWYIVLTVTNNTESEDVSFYPSCELMTDTFQIIPADKGVPGEIFQIVKQRTQGRYPFLESLDFLEHRIFKGPDNTRDFAIIWPDFDPNAKEISLFIGGLSNETAILKQAADPNAPAAEPVILQKTLRLRYAIGGDPKLRDAAVLKEIKADWIMR